MPKAETLVVDVPSGTPSFRYTRADTPEVVARIRSDLERITGTVRAADPALRALVLTGGFARGEGTVLGGEPQNDYDLVAIRGWGRPERPYPEVIRELEAGLGLHVDLAAVADWRLPWVAPSIFWYETALRGRVLWGRDVLDRIPIREPTLIAPGEALRLLSNRAAGLLLVTRQPDEHAYRIQAAKALLAAKDVHLLALGRFPPSQTERWHEYHRAGHLLPDTLTRHAMAIEWAFTFKTGPEAAPPMGGEEAWEAARAALLDAVPAALGHTGHPRLPDALLSDRLVDRLVYRSRAHTLPGARRKVRHPTGSVRLATLQMLSDAEGPRIDDARARARLAGLYVGDLAPLDALEALRTATLQ